MRFIALVSLAVAAAAGLWYTSNSRLPYYYDAGIFVLAITGAVLLVDISPNSRARRPRRIVRDGDEQGISHHLRLSPDRLSGRTLEMGHRRVLYALADHRRHRRRQDEFGPQQTVNLTHGTLSAMGSAHP